MGLNEKSSALMAPDNGKQLQRSLLATPAGAYFAVSANDEDALRTALFDVMARPGAWPASTERWPSPDGGAAPDLPARDVVDRLLQLEWVEFAARDAEPVSAEPLERQLLELLPALSGEGRALLADHQGLPIALAGFDEIQGQGLAALSSEAIALGLRHRRLLAGSSTRTPAAWAMVDAAGNSQIGVWPLFFGQRWFALVIAGRPLLARPAFLRLVRTLVRRAATPGTISTPAGSRPELV